jgi:hypothetical protein
MKQYLKCLIFVALVALILLPAYSNTENKPIVVHAEQIKKIAVAPAPVAKIVPNPAPVIPPVDPPPPKPTPSIAGNHEELLSEAGIPATAHPAADKIIQLESSWDIHSVEPTTGACGLAQELPCGKSGCTTSQPVCELRWANTYVTSRYGSWDAALSFHYAHNWY